MSTIDISYLGIVLFAFIGFAAVLAYYSQTCADPDARADRASEPNAALGRLLISR